MNFQEQQRELQIQKQIRQAEDDLVTWVEAALNDTKTYGDLQESQFRNLVRVADTTESPEVIKNFLRYQVGRDKKWGEGKNSLAEKIVADIDKKIKEKVEEIATNIVKGLEKDGEKKDSKDLECQIENVDGESDKGIETKDLECQIENADGESDKGMEESEKKGIWVELIRRYLGYGARRLKYLKSL